MMTDRDAKIWMITVAVCVIAIALGMTVGSWLQKRMGLDHVENRRPAYVEAVYTGAAWGWASNYWDVASLELVREAS